MATPMPEPIDFAEHGRLLEIVRQSPILGIVSYAEWCEANSKMLDSIDAYRAVVLAADYFIKTGSGEAKVRLRAVLSAFKNIGGAK